MNSAANDSVIQSISKIIKESGVTEMAQFNLDQSTTIFHNKKDYEIFFVVDNKGEVIGDASGGIYRKTSIAGKDYFQKAIKGDTVIGQVVKAEKSGQEYIIAASPMKTPENEIIGAIVSGWKMDYINKIISDIKLGNTGYAFLIAKDGMIIAHPDTKMIMQVNIKNVKGMENVAKRMTSLQKGLEECVHEGQDKVVAFGPIEVSGWSLGLIIPKSEYMAPIERMRNIILLTGVVILGLIALVLVWAIRHIITKPINRITESLIQGADQVVSASAQISSSSQSLAGGASEQASSLEETSSSLEETSSSLEEMSSMTKQNADNATQADTLMTGANQTVEKATTSMNELTTSMEEISKASEETSKIVKTIDEIAFQTNLLALNAAVEAARAGEAGAGFAVVADEVRSLALRAADAASTTSNLIEGTVKKVKGGAELVTRTNEAFNEVAKSSSKVGELVGEIAAASQEQTQGIEQVNKAVAEMDKVIQQTAANAQESASAGEQMNAQAEQMKEVVGELAAMVGESVKRATDRTYGEEQRGQTGGRKARALPPYKAITAQAKGREMAAPQKKHIIKPDEAIPGDEGEFKDF